MVEPHLGGGGGEGALSEISPDFWFSFFIFWSSVFGLRGGRTQVGAPLLDGGFGRCFWDEIDRCRLGLGFSVWGFGSSVQGFGVEGLGFGVWELELGIWS